MTTDDLGIPDRPQTKEASRGAGFPLVPASVKGERVKRLVRLTSGHFSRREARNGTPVKSYLRQERTVADPVRCENLSLMGKKRPAPRRRGSWDQRLEDASRKIGARVKVILETREIPQARLAEHLNVGENHVSGLLSGAKRWNLPLFLGTRDFLGTPASSIIGDLQGDQQEAFAKVVTVLTPEVTDWLLGLTDLEVKIALRGAQDAVDLSRYRDQ
jgi:hypothetical protein